PDGPDASLASPGGGAESERGGRRSPGHRAGRRASARTTRSATSSSPALLLRERDELSFVTDHDMIEHADADQLTDLPEPLRDGPILGRGCRVAARVVVDEDQGRGVREDRGLEDLAWMNERG